MPLDLTDDQIREWVVRTRAACGLGPKVTDRAALRRIITLAFTGLPEHPERPELADGESDHRHAPASPA
jgi:hypothetical protein